ncbi:MAG: hypothetical protein CFE26_03765 [Verrucomicrobiales bacterium VVV1]|nr:MAG: hypothetical protein CFE26_03765 [Verrucomicrobiales bacterium VVV1]
MNQLALGFFIAALVCFVVFHFVPLPRQERGWMVWKKFFSSFTELNGPYSAILLVLNSSFFGMTLLSLVSPFLIPFICWNKRICRVVGYSSLFTLIVFVFFSGALTFVPSYFGWLFVWQALEVIGFFCIRRPQPEEFVPAPHLDA